MSGAPLMALGTYLPRYGTDSARVVGPGEDAITLGVAAGREACSVAEGVEIRSVAFISRDLPLLEGGLEAVLLGGLGLDRNLPVSVHIGGAPSVLDVLASAEDNTLVLAADLSPAGAAAALLGSGRGPRVEVLSRIERSLPVHARTADGVVHDFDDPRLLRERGVKASLAATDLDSVDALAGVTGRSAGGFSSEALASPPTSGASSSLFALAGLTAVLSSGGTVAGVEEASVVVARLTPGRVAISRREKLPLSPPERDTAPGPPIKISLAAYDRAFDSKVRLAAGQCEVCGALSLPVRRRCIECGDETDKLLTPLPRKGAVYSVVTVHVPVPGLASPYSVAVIAFDPPAEKVRLLAQVADAEPGDVTIGRRGELVFRRVAERSGVPDYGYAFVPTEMSESEAKA